MGWRVISLAEADTLHRLSRTRALTYHEVAHPLFREFSQRSRDLLRSLGETADDPEWADFLRAMRRFRFEACVAPLPFADPAFAPRLDEPMLRRFVAFATRAFPRFAADTGRLVDLLLALRASADNPLLATIVSIVAPTGTVDTAILLPESRFVEPVRALLRRPGGIGGLEVIAPAATRGESIYRRLIAIGAARWFPDHVFSASRAEHVDVVSYAWLPARWRPAPSFLAGAECPPPPRAEDDEIAPSFDWVPLERRLAGADHHGPVGDPHDQIEARLYLLEGGHAVFLDASGRRANMIVDLEAEERDRVRQVADAAIEPGMFVVLRTDSGGDYIAPVADRLMGEKAAPYRAAQRRWKERLRDEVRRYGLSIVCAHLSALGAGIADETNVRNWMSDRNIAPRDERDFKAIARFVGLGGEADRLFTIARTVRAAHYYAGTKIRGWLIERVRVADAAELERNGRLDFALPEVEGGRLTAFRLERRSDHTTRLSASRIERVFGQEI